MKEIGQWIERLWHAKVIGSLILIIISFILYKITISILDKGENKSRLFSTNRGKTYLKLIKSIIRYIFIIVTTLMILQLNGVNITSVLTGVGIFGVIFGLAIQDWLKDIIRGSSIISDSYFEVGDIVKYKEIEGKVLVIGLKTTKIKELKTGNVISIANRNIEEIEKVSSLIYLKIPMPYEVKLERAEEAINDIVEQIKKNNNVKNTRYIGVTELADSSIQYLLEIECNQEFKLQVRRDALRSILQGMAKHKIEVPYTQIDIHNK